MDCKGTLIFNKIFSHNLSLIIFFSLLFLQKEKVEELQSIIRQSAKERLWLERQISNGDPSRTPSPLLSSGDFAGEIRKKTERLDTVEAENRKLKASVEQLQKAEAESAKLVCLLLKFVVDLIYNKCYHF